MPNLLILDRRDAILAVEPLLQQLTSRCGQPGAMHWLPYFLSPGVLRRRSPRLVLVLRPEGDSTRGLGVDDVEAAALFFEYEVLGRRTGILATADAVGFSSVIAPWGDRARTAALAARALLEGGASYVLATYEGSGGAQLPQLMRGLAGCVMAERQRRVNRMLPLRATLDDTLAQMGKSTRANLRRYRRRAEAQLRCEFVADATRLIADADLAALNEGSLNPTTLEEVQRRIQAASTLPGSFLCGLRAADGRWLALLGGWRQDRTTVLHWQMNAAGFEKLSLGTVARSYFLEHEIAFGAERLMFYGGTPHTMRHAFEAQTIADLAVRRRGVRSFALGLLSRLYDAPSRRFGRGNFVAATLRARDLDWVATAAEAAPQRTPLLKPRQTQPIV